MNNFDKKKKKKENLEAFLGLLIIFGLFFFLAANIFTLYVWWTRGSFWLKFPLVAGVISAAALYLLSQPLLRQEIWRWGKTEEYLEEIFRKLNLLIALGAYLLISIYGLYAAYHVWYSLEYVVISNDFVTVWKTYLSPAEAEIVQRQALASCNEAWDEEHADHCRIAYESFRSQGRGPNAELLRSTIVNVYLPYERWRRAEEKREKEINESRFWRLFFGFCRSIRPSPNSPRWWGGR